MREASSDSNTPATGAAGHGSGAAARLTGRAAMVAVLTVAGGPLKIAELVERALALDGVAVKGKTPAKTLAAVLALSNKRGGEFERVAPGSYTLRPANHTNDPQQQPPVDSGSKRPR